MEMAEEEKAVSVHVRFEQVFLWATSKRSSPNSIPTIYSKNPEHPNGNCVFLDQW